jgi:hypothetical protein
MNRRNFLDASLKALLAVFFIPELFSACGASSTTAATTTAPISGGNCLANGTIATIAGNHGHVIIVSHADIVAAVDKTYDITGTAGHSHSVTITAADFTNLTANQGIVELSTTTGHNHSITVNCA